MSFFQNGKLHILFNILTIMLPSKVYNIFFGVDVPFKMVLLGVLKIFLTYFLFYFGNVHLL